MLRSQLAKELWSLVVNLVVQMLLQWRVTRSQDGADSMIFKQLEEDIVQSSMETKYTSLGDQKHSESFE